MVQGVGPDSEQVTDVDHGSSASLTPAHPASRIGRRQAVQTLALAAVGLGAGFGPGSAHAGFWQKLSGQGEGSQPDAAGSRQPGARFQVSVYPAIDQMILAARPAWQQRMPKVEFDLQAREFRDHHTAMTTALSTRSHLPDLMALEVGYLGRFASSGGFIDLRSAPYDLTQYRSQWLDYPWHQATNARGEVIALPLDVAPGTLFYRQDLLDQAGVKVSDLSETWEGFVAAGRQIKAKTGQRLVADAHALKDVIVRSGLKAGQGLYFGVDGEVLVESPRFQRAFALALQVRQAGLDGRAKAWSSDWQEMLRGGRVATQMMGAWLGGHLANWLAPQTAGRWRVSHLPEGTHLAWGGTFLAIPKWAREPERAFELARLLTLDRAQQLTSFRQQDAFPSLLACFDDAFFEQAMPFLGGQAARLLWRESARQIQAVPVHRYDALAQEMIDNALDLVLLGKAAIPEVLAHVARLLRKRVALRAKVTA